MKQPTNKFQVRKLYHKATKYANEQLIDEEEILKDNITQDFYTDLQNMVNEREIIIININAKPRLGKSTAGWAIAQKIHDYMKQANYIPKTEKFGTKNIARDQQEHNQFMKNPKNEFNVILTDESNALENTGLNITAEKALERVMSDVQAARQIHRVCCSPNEIIDDNSDMIIQIVSKKRQTYQTYAKIYYRLQEKGQETIQLVGHAIIDCKHIVQTWEDKVSNHFYKPNKNKKDHDIIEKYKKEDPYTAYVIKKHQKMELITKEGVFRPRELQEAEIKLDVINKHRAFCKYTKITPQRLQASIKIECKRKKMPLSLITPYELSKDIQPILDNLYEHQNVNNKIKKLDHDYITGKLTLPKEAYQHKSQELKKYADMLYEDSEELIQELKNLVELKNKYDTHGETTT